MTHDEIAQNWVEGLKIIQHLIGVVQNEKVWQANPKKALAAANRINSLKQWCLKAMDTMPEVEVYFLSDIKQRGDDNTEPIHHPFFFAQPNQAVKATRRKNSC